MFADVSVLIKSHANPGTTASYFSKLKLKLNAGKTKILNIDVKVKKSNMLFPDLMNNGVVIVSVHSFCYLGMNIDRGLKLDTHLKNYVRRAHSKIYMLRKLSVYMDKLSAF